MRGESWPFGAKLAAEAARSAGCRQACPTRDHQISDRGSSGDGTNLINDASKRTFSFPIIRQKKVRSFKSSTEKVKAAEDGVREMAPTATEPTDSAPSCVETELGDGDDF